MCLSGAGLSYKQIAERMGNTMETVHSRMGEIRDKLGCKNKTMVVMESLRLGIISLEEIPE